MVLPEDRRVDSSALLAMLASGTEPEQWTAIGQWMNFAENG